LVASLYADDPAMQKLFMQEAEAGILRINPDTLDIDPAAPFGGWKDSCIGPPEHGRWDREFYTRPQAVYRADKLPSRQAALPAPTP
jgi:acyl-CoA reductase-like NAD-dependent aldehyde dehydrogenase